MGSLADMASSQGNRRWRRFDLPYKKIMCHQNREIWAMERDAYFGGRSECYRLGKIKGEFFHLDVKSMYAHIAETEKLPRVLLDDGGERNSSIVYLHAARHRHVIAKVLLETSIPAYPVRHRDKTVYPVGRFVTTLCWPELQMAIMNCHVVQFEKWALVR